MLENNAVYERVGVVFRVLQAWRARGRVGADVTLEFERATARFATFRGDAERDGISAAFDGAVAALRALAGRLTEVERAEIDGVVEALQGVEREVDRLAQTEASRRRTDVTGDRPPRFLSASDAMPALHAADDPPSTAAEGRADRHAAAHLTRVARDAIEELASLSLLRAAADDAPWSGAEHFERRLLESLDAARTYGRGRHRIDVDALATRLARDFPVVERSRWFAALFLLACMSGERATSALRQAILELPAAARPAAVDALALGSNPRLSAVALSLLDEDDRPELLEIGLAAADRLGIVDEGAAMALTEHPSDRIAARAARALLRVAPERSTPRLEGLLDRPGAAIEAAFVLAARGAEIGLQHLRLAATRGAADGATLDETRTGTAATQRLAPFGRDRDQGLLLAAAERDDGLVACLADHGSPALLAPLRKALERGGRDARAQAAGRALVRMTGVEAPWPGLREGEIDVEAYGRALARFEAPAGAQRLVAGEKLDAAALARELANELMPGCDRARAAQRFVAVTGAPLPFDPEGWVAAQRAALVRITRGADASPASLGGAGSVLRRGAGRGAAP